MPEEIDLDTEVENYLIGCIRNLGGHPTEANWADEVVMGEIYTAIGPKRAKGFKEAHVLGQGPGFLLRKRLTK